MQTNILACILSAVTAICLYASVAHLLAGRQQWFRTVHIVFAGIAAMGGVHALAHIGVYSAQTAAEYVAASRISNISGALAMALIPWLIRGYFGAPRSRVLPALMSCLYLVSAALNELTTRLDPLLEQVVLPWGEQATIHRLSTTPLSLVVFWFVSSLLLAHVMQLAVRRRRHGNQRQTVAMVASLAILMLALAGNVLVLADRLDGIFMGEFGFLALVLTMLHLLSSGQSYRSLLAQASTGMFVVSADGRFLEANRAACRMLGLTRNELRRTNASEIIEGPLQLSAGDAGNQETTHGLQRLRRKDGSSLLTDLSKQTLADGRCLYFARDVTETERANAAIRWLAQTGPHEHSEEFYGRCAEFVAAAFDVGHALIGRFEADGSVRALGEWSRETLARSSYSQAAAPCAKLHESRRSLHTARAAAEFPEHTLFHGENINGYLGSAIFSKAGEIVGVIEVWDERPFVAGIESHALIAMFAHRIGAELERAESDSALRHLTANLEARIDERTAELAQANEELEAFSYSVSHDLRTPLRAMGAHVELLGTHLQNKMDEATSNHLHRIGSAVRRMRELIDGLLALARLSHQALLIETVDLSRLAQQSFELLQQRDPQRSVQFVCAVDLTTQADQTAASVVLANLIENAWKYSARTPTPRIEFGVEDMAGERIYFVRDNGVGFDMQHAKHLFEPFRRLHGDGDFPGSGIGLATVQRIIKRHRGRIWAQSERDRGATFYFTLAATDPPSQLNPITTNAAPVAISSGND